MAVFRPPPQPFIGGAQPDGPKQPYTLGATANQVVQPGAGGLVITGFAPAVTQSGGTIIAPGVGSLTITGFAPTVTRTGSGSITTPVIKNNTGSVLASETGATMNIYNSSTGALIVQKTGQTTDGSGVMTVTDAALVGGTTYAYEVVLATNGRRLPTVAAV